MMMVDTINPNTSEPDAFSSAPGVQPDPLASAQTSASNHFYGGFDKPDDVKINLASQNIGETPFTAAAPDVPSPVTPDPGVANTTVPEQPVNNNPFADLTPAAPSPNETQLHSSYTKRTPLNTRGILVIVGVGLVATIIISTITFFAVSSSNSSKLSKQQASLDELTAKLSGLTEAPSPLTATETETTTSTTPVVVETPVTTPTIESTETKVPEKVNDTANAAG